MLPRDWLLVFLALPTGPTGEEQGTLPNVDPIRIQKGLFLLAMEGGVPKSERYDFIPYNYGACSFDIYGDLDSLVRNGMLERIQGPSDPWPTYRPTSVGLEEVRATIRAADSEVISYLRSTKEKLFGQGFIEMLREIYKKYPQYAVNSLLKIA